MYTYIYIYIYIERDIYTHIIIITDNTSDMCVGCSNQDLRDMLSVPNECP